MVVRCALFAILLGSSLVVPGPAAAAGWLDWLARTMAEALISAGQGDAEPDLGSGSEVLLDRGISTVAKKLQRAAPALNRFEANLGFDERARPVYGLALSQPLVRGRGRAFDLAGRFGYQPDGPAHQALTLSYRDNPGSRRAGLAPTGLMVELERTEDAGTDRTRHAVAAEIAWIGLEFGGGLRADQPAAGPRQADGSWIDGAHAHLKAPLPRLPWAAIETRGRWSTGGADPTRLEMSEASYLVRACPFGPLELTAGRRDGGSPEPHWFTRLQLKLQLGGGT